jgi:hypothetical protein
MRRAYILETLDRQKSDVEGPKREQRRAPADGGRNRAAHQELPNHRTYSLTDLRERQSDRSIRRSGGH